MVQIELSSLTNDVPTDLYGLNFNIFFSNLYYYDFLLMIY